MTKANNPKPLGLVVCGMILLWLGWLDLDQRIDGAESLASDASYSAAEANEKAENAGRRADEAYSNAETAGEQATRATVDATDAQYEAQRAKDAARDAETRSMYYGY